MQSPSQLMLNKLLQNTGNLWTPACRENVFVDQSLPDVETGMGCFGVLVVDDDEFNINDILLPFRLHMKYVIVRTIIITTKPPTTAEKKFTLQCGLSTTEEHGTFN